MPSIECFLFLLASLVLKGSQIFQSLELTREKSGYPAARIPWILSAYCQHTCLSSRFRPSGFMFSHSTCETTEDLMRGCAPRISSAFVATYFVQDINELIFR